MRFAQMLICLTVAVFSSPGHLTAFNALASTSPQSKPAHTSTFKEFDRKPVTISEEEFKALRGRVMSRCHVAPGTDSSKAPWYFHYELGLELEKRGDPQRALDALIEATNHRPDPKRDARMYGMWFTDYKPYFEIAKMHFALGNLQCAADALKLSKQEQEVRDGDKDYFDFRAFEVSIGEKHKHR